LPLKRSTLSIRHVNAKLLCQPRGGNFSFSKKRVLEEDKEELERFFDKKKIRKRKNDVGIGSFCLLVAGCWHNNLGSSLLSTFKI
jgi:hypothetical protein